MDKIEITLASADHFQSEYTHASDASLAAVGVILLELVTARSHDLFQAALLQFLRENLPNETCGGVFCEDHLK